MTNCYGHRLLWDISGPAPYESSWSIFTKLLLLNGMNYKHVASQISNSSYRGFRDSSWIDFERFSRALSVDKNRLRAAFLDQLGFQIDIERDPQLHSHGIKICRQCIANGYHCVFFELGFINSCPWHQVKLEKACRGCVDFVLRQKLKKENKINGGNHRSSLNTTYSKESVCGHIKFLDSVNFSPVRFDLLRQRAIANHCQQFLEWCKIVCKCPEVSRVIFQHGYDDRKVNELEQCLSAAESIAGNCPWPLSDQHFSVRTHRWRSPQQDFDKEMYLADRGTDWDKAYRSMRRHIFRRYLREHRECWNELNSYSRVDALWLDADSVCPVALAYAAWRLASEQLVDIEAFKISRLRDRKIRVLNLEHLDISLSLNAHTSLLYAQFFILWGKILKLSKETSFALHLKGHVDKDDFVILLEALSQCPEWTVIFPDYNTLINQSATKCLAQLRGRGWMVSPGWGSFWGEYQIAGGLRDLFRVKKFHPSKRFRYWYINLS